MAQPVLPLGPVKNWLWSQGNTGRRTAKAAGGFTLPQEFPALFPHRKAVNLTLNIKEALENNDIQTASQQDGSNECNGLIV